MEINESSGVVYRFSSGNITAAILPISGKPPPARRGYASALFSTTSVVWGGTVRCKEKEAEGLDNSSLYLFDTGMLSILCERNSVDINGRNLDENEWTKVTPTSRFPECRSEHSVSMIDAKFFVFRGQVGLRYLNDL